jgi:hypothetical protein
MTISFSADGALENSPQLFSCGLIAPKMTSPGGAAETKRRFSFAPPGLGLLFIFTRG